MQQLSVYDLRQYWSAIDKMVEGDRMECYAFVASASLERHLFRTRLEIHRVDGGYFDMKRYGYCGVYGLIGLASEGDLTQPPRQIVCAGKIRPARYTSGVQRAHMVA